MREDESNWLSRSEDELPLPEELMPLSQTLISADLAIAFHITNPSQQQQQQQQQDEETARTLKRPRLVWTPQLHKRFVDVVAHLGIKNAVPKTIMQLMSVDGLTRENVASHLQKYRLYLKRMQGFSSAAGDLPPAPSADPATDRLFASSPVPPHFLHPTAARATSDHYLPFVSVPPPQHHMPVAASHRHYGSLPPNGHFELPFLSTIGAPVTGFPDDVESGGRKVLTLFPAGDG